MLVRPGARFTCHADGLCCSDIHVLGPIEEPELVPLRRLGNRGSRVVGRDASIDGWAFRVVETGACPFLEADNLCRVHATRGPELKPATCRLFPFYLVGTPAGVRVSTSHRCTCRSVGDRAPLDVARVRAEIGVADEALSLAWTAPARIAIDAERDVSFAEWTVREARLIEALNAGVGLSALLGSPPFPTLRNDGWDKVAARLCSPADATGFEQAKAWIGEAIRAHVDGTAIAERPRPWARFLPRVAARSVRADERESMLADWLADELWGLGWTRWGTFEQARMDFSTRAAIVTALEASFARLGTPSPIAMAEAILVVDAVAHSPHWDAVARALPRRARG
ncbi:MAG TPA: YkgJ family cysteine cluster protein [Polyangia bacterium]|jgi:Fe-S-cluster containining protein|nr:YkgJ family cysteine cluster protein [Polyangia bacterium]